jgi:hypothetical protein
MICGAAKVILHPVAVVSILKSDEEDWEWKLRKRD